MKKPNNSLNSYAKYSSITLQMFVIIIIGVGGGVILDKWIGIKFPVFTLFLSVFSVGTAIYIATKDFIKKK
ncbi:MAG: AtpZ/AtpI family protein [Bacteroidota bacterium]